MRRSLGAVACGATLDDYELQTVMCEVEAVVNNRSVTKVSDDKNDEEPLTPSHLMSLGSTGTLPPVFGASDDQYRRRWKNTWSIDSGGAGPENTCPPSSTGANGLWTRQMHILAIWF